MADFPASVYAPRAIENLPGIVFDVDATKTFFAEDLNATNDEIVAIEETLGENPQGSYDTVRDWLDALEAGGGGGGGSSISTPLIFYVETDGDDAIAEAGNPGKPYLTAQAAYDAGVASGAFILQLGYGGYVITLASDFSANCLNILGRGGQEVFSLSVPTNLSIYANGVDAVDGDAGNGFDGVINCDCLNLQIYSNGGQSSATDGGTYNSGNGGNWFIRGSCVLFDSSLSGGGSSGSSSGNVNSGDAGILYLFSHAIRNGAVVIIDPGVPYGSGTTGASGSLYADGVCLGLSVSVYLVGSPLITLGRCSYRSDATWAGSVVNKGGNAIW